MTERRSIVGILDNVRSLYNVGSMFRTADAFALNHLYLCGITGSPADELSRKRISKTSLGAEETLPWSYQKQTVDLIAKLKQAGYKIIALEQTPQAIPLAEFKTDSQKLALIVGHELYGVHTDALTDIDYHVMIPMLGHKESLNVAVAFGITVHSLRPL